MKMMIALFVVIFVIALPLIALKAERDARTAGLPKIVRPALPVRPSASSGKPDSTDTLPPCTALECIEGMNAGYRQMWAGNPADCPQTQSVCASQPPVLRYAISDEERREIERIVASEGGYCGYEFQALVAECILNGCEAENMRPSELFERGDFWLTHDVEPTETTKRAVSDVFDRGIMPTAEKVRYYYNPNYCESSMHEQMCYVLTCCDCRFFKDWE